MKLLHLDSSILGDTSVSRALTAAVVARLRTPGVEVTYRDLAATPLTHLSGAYLAGRSVEAKHDQAMQEDVALGGAVLDEFLAADTVVVGAPMYNFTISSQLKAWVDRICVAGRTFRYTDKGAIGLCDGKRVVLALSRGGIYSPGSPRAGAEHAESYLRTVFGFLGVTALEAIQAEGIALSAERRESALTDAKAAAAQLPTAA